MSISPSVIEAAASSVGERQFKSPVPHTAAESPQWATLLTSWLSAIKLLCSSLANSRLFVTSWYFDTASLKSKKRKKRATNQKEDKIHASKKLLAALTISK